MNSCSSPTLTSRTTTGAKLTRLYYPPAQPKVPRSLGRLDAARYGSMIGPSALDWGRSREQSDLHRLRASAFGARSHIPRRPEALFYRGGDSSLRHPGRQDDRVATLLGLTCRNTAELHVVAIGPEAIYAGVELVAAGVLKTLEGQLQLLVHLLNGALHKCHLRRYAL